MQCAKPSKNNTIDESQAAKEAAEAAIQKAKDSLNNTEDQAKGYVNSHTKGIVQLISSQNQAYSKFSDEYSLDKLEAVVDGLVKAAKDKLSNDHPDSKAADIASDIGEIVKSTLSLFATSSSTDQNLQVVFNQFRLGEDNYALYYATNSMTVKAQNAWGNKEIIVASNMYYFTQVSPDPGVTYAEVLQRDLDTLKILNEQYDKAIIEAKTEAEFNSLDFYRKKINRLTQKIQDELKKELKKLKFPSLT